MTFFFYVYLHNDPEQRFIWIWLITLPLGWNLTSFGECNQNISGRYKNSGTEGNLDNSIRVNKAGNVPFAITTIALRPELGRWRSRHCCSDAHAFFNQNTTSLTSTEAALTQQRHGSVARLISHSVTFHPHMHDGQIAEMVWRMHLDGFLMHIHLHVALRNRRAMRNLPTQKEHSSFETCIVGSETARVLFSQWSCGSELSQFRAAIEKFAR